MRDADPYVPHLDVSIADCGSLCSGRGVQHNLTLKTVTASNCQKYIIL